MAKDSTGSGKWASYNSAVKRGVITPAGLRNPKRTESERSTYSKPYDFGGGVVF